MATPSKTPRDSSPAIRAGMLTADEARAIAGDTVYEKVQTLLTTIGEEAKKKNFSLRVPASHKDDDLWITLGRDRAGDWLIARTILQDLGYSVTFTEGTTLISWGA